VPNRSILPFPTEYSIALQGKSRETAAVEIDNVMVSLDLRWIWKQERWAGLAFTSENVWSRAARRKQQRKRNDGPNTAESMELDQDEEENSDVDTVPLGVKITVGPEMVEIRWLRGLDNVLFESFCGMLKRHLAT
jgi:23S rRNA (adenine1618-N6)-methyltransferase